MIDAGAVPQRIDDQPVFGVRLAAEVLAECLPHCRTGAIGTDQKTRLHDRRAFAIDTMQLCSDAIAVVAEARQAEPVCLAYASVPFQIGTQSLFERRLVKRHELGMPVDAASRVDAAELADQRRMHADLGNRQRRKSLLWQTQHLQDA